MNLYSLIDRLKEAAAEVDVLSEDKPYVFFKTWKNDMCNVDSIYIDEDGDIILEEEN